uniref:Homeobox-DDT domain protein RLT1 n=1 Tax=Davidia involucrata TaxID=16924 RepID=A0A5B7A7I4_DAVIN
MEAGSEGENTKTNNSSPSEGPKKPKRQMKTPYQLETLEKTYALETYPSESTRAELSEKLGLSDRQLQMWFCHRRLKNKKDAAVKKLRATGAVATTGLLDSPRDELMVTEPDSDHGSGSGSGSGSSHFDYGDDVPMVQRYYDSSQSVMVLRVIACVESQLGEPLSEDGPILGMEFDELPPGAFGAPIAMAEQRDVSGHSYEGKLFDRSDAKPIKAAKRGRHECQFLPDEPSIRSDAGRLVPSHFYDLPVDGPSGKTSSLVRGNRQLCRGYFSSPPGDNNSIPHRDSLINIQMDAPVSAHPVLGPENSNASSDKRISNNEDVLQMGRKRKNVEVRIEREVEVYERKIKKELEKQDILRRKREEQMRKEMEKQDRERRKEEERLIREKQRNEERSLREERREMERREKFLQKESLRAERRRQKEELRREKEAARLKAAVERSTARKIARESMELIEDERLELMELAASSKGLPSMISLDHDTLQNLESFKDFLCAFPPKSVQLKKPFAIQPWIDSKENIGNLLMVWRFCITFADVLELWPFTLDEFVQAFHDYESRLLGEIHISLLKLIIKDIEDVARTPSIGLGTNQYSAANAEGGHPQIVEGAYLWGFDIRSWCNHLNPLTWPEIFRQLALSAGFGPQLKKKTIEQAYLRDNDEGKGCQDIVSTLRNGSAAEHAVAIMQEKGLPLQRRSKHRLTPGTVKFAAYHVLSLEGSKGSMVLELADKIQKSGLRDLTTSKTPEASISVALSRDAILFERTAPSTYRVRSAFRKDPADAETILLAAREKIQRYKNGFLAGENADDVERDEDSECDVAEGPEIDDLGTPSDANKNNSHNNEVSTCSGNGKENICNDAALDLQNELESAGIGTSNPDQGDTEIDESKSGEPWVQGLTEGEYSDLCVEERLNSLVTLICIANDGNSIRSVLEDRLDAANALKKQMWAEAQLDKRRMKEESLTKFHCSFMGSAAEGSQSPLTVVGNKNDEASLSSTVKEEPFIGADNVQNHLNSLPAERSLVLHDASIGQITYPVQQNGYAAERSRSQLKSYIGHRAEEMYVYRSLPLGQDRRHNRYWQFVASASRNDPGSGRIFVESPDGYWSLVDSEEAFDALLMSLDTRGVRESHLHIMLQIIEMSFKENVRRNLLGANIVDRNGNTVGNEAAEMGYSPACAASADSPRSTVCGSNPDTMEPSTSFRIDIGRNEMEKKSALKRYQDFQMWMWKECFNSSTLRALTYGKKRCTPLLGICDFCLDSYVFNDDHCPSCRGASSTYDNKLRVLEDVIPCKEKWKVDPKGSNISDSSHPSRIRLLKALLTFMEVTVPSEALQFSWTENHRKTWGIKLHTSSSTKDLLQILTQFEGFIRRDCLLSNFETTEELLGCCPLSGRDVCDSANPGSVPQLPWIPHTTAAVALRLLELDGSISYLPHQKIEPHNDKEAEDFIKLPSRYTLMKNIQEAKPTELFRDEQVIEENWADLGGVCGSSGSKRVVRGRGGGRSRGSWQRKVAGSILESGRKNFRDDGTLNQVLRQQGQVHGQRSGWGRRNVRGRRTEKRAVEQTPPLGSPNSASTGESPGNPGMEEWVGEEVGKMQIEDANNNSNSMEEIESDDDARAIGYKYGKWEPSFNVASNRRAGDLMGISDEDGTEDDDDSEEDEDENLEGDVDMNECSDENGDGDEDEDEGTSSAVSEDYSD